MRPFSRKSQVAKKGNYAFIDSQNLNLGTQKMGWKMDWKKFRAWLQEEYNVEKAFMFIGYMPDYETLYAQLYSQGYLVVLKPTLEMFHTEEPQEAKSQSTKAEDEKTEEKKTVKGNIDADLVLHVMKEYANYDKAVIVSGDGDFYTLLEYLDQENKLQCLLTPNWQYSSLLKPYDKYIVRLDQKRQILRYPDYRNKKPNRIKIVPRNNTSKSPQKRPKK
ncbi:NYN domain-containing protein [Candidatus Saccharibacteria bacterium]|nr:NYN domain-containing protein [Candidatus Saccharibacteria bacterium]